MLAVMTVSVSAPAARAVTMFSLTVTLKVSGQTATSTFRVIDVDNDGVVDLAVGSTLLSDIHSAFGTTTFAFPGSFTGTFTINGTTMTVTVTLSSTDMFVLKFTLAG